MKGEELLQCVGGLHAIENQAVLVLRDPFRRRPQVEYREGDTQPHELLGNVRECLWPDGGQQEDVGATLLDQMGQFGSPVGA